MVFQGRLHTQSGFTLLESLIAFLILSIGLVGLANLHWTLVQQGQSAYLQSQAILLAQSIVEQRRANPSVNVTAWQQQVSRRLPAGESIVCLDSSPLDGTSAAVTGCDQRGTLFVAKLWWNHDRDPTTAKQRLSLSFVL